MAILPVDIVRLQYAAAATGDGNTINTLGYSIVSFQVTGTFTATITFEGTLDGATWVSLQAFPAAGGAATATATTTGAWIASCAGLARCRARVTWGSGTSVTVLASAIDGSAMGSQPSLTAGSAIIGKVGIDQTTPGTTDSVTVKSQGFASRVSVTRTNDTNGYTAGDVLGPATGSTAALTFASIGPSGGGEVLLTSATFERDASALISGETSYTLHLYNVTPPSALGDNAAFDLPSGDRASYLGAINLGTPVDLGSTLYVATDSINKQLTLASSSVFGYLVTNGAYTPVAQAVHVVTLHSMRV